MTGSSRRTRARGRSAAEKRILLACLVGPPLLLILMLVGAWQVPRVRESAYIALMFKAPHPSMRSYAARLLVDHPTDRTVGALALFLNTVDYEENEEVAVRALTTLCIITGQTFGTSFEGNKYRSSIGYPGAKDWPKVVASVNAWAVSRVVGSLARETPQAKEYAVPRKVRSLLDRMAGEDPERGAAAWLELGAAYMSAEDYVRDAGPALVDVRPINFIVFEDQFPQAGKPPRRFFTAKGTPIYHAGDKPLARTVGEALRFHLWQYEDVGGRGFPGSFEEWWREYAAARGLPAGGPTQPPAEGAR